MGKKKQANAEGLGWGPKRKGGGGVWGAKSN